MIPALAVSRASALVLRRHVVRSVGGHGPAVVIGSLALVMTLAMNFLLFQFYDTHFSAAFDPDLAPLPRLRQARSALVFAQLMTAPVIALGLVMLTPAVPRTRPAARIAGASRGAVVVGESAPLLGAVALVVAVSGIGPTWFFAGHQHHQVATFITMTTTAVALGLAAVALSTFVIAGVRAANGSVVLARLTSVLLAFSVFGAALGELLNATAHGRASLVGSVVLHLWDADVDGLNASTAVRGTVLAVLAVTAVMIGKLLERDGGAFPHHPKLFALRSIGAPSRLVNGVARETLLLLRHPVGQTTTAAATVLAVLLLLGTRSGMIPPPVAISISAMLFSANAETAFGRSAPTSWVRRLAGTRPMRIVLEQYLGVLAPGAVLVLASSTAIALGGPGTVASVPITVASAMTLFAMLSAIAYLAGVLLPYDEAAPTAAVATSLVTLALEAAVLWLSSLVADPGAVLTSAVHVVIGLLVLSIARLVVHQRI
jgi:hypothetical protein